MAEQEEEEEGRQARLQGSLSQREKQGTDHRALCSISSCSNTPPSGQTGRSQPREVQSLDPDSLRVLSGPYVSFSLFPGQGTAVWLCVLCNSHVAEAAQCSQLSGHPACQLDIVQGAVPHHQTTAKVQARQDKQQSEQLQQRFACSHVDWPADKIRGQDQWPGSVSALLSRQPF